MSEIEDVLDRLARAEAWSPDWSDVRARARRRAVRRHVTGRRLAVALAALLVVLVPLGAFASSNDWWFLGSPGTPTPTSSPIVVERGVWEGHPWQLVAYPSTRDGLCLSMTPKGSEERGEGAALSCAPFQGVPRTRVTKDTPDLTITFLAGGASNELPAYIAGPVIDEAVGVVIRFANGVTLRAPTTSAPAPLDHIRFYAARLPPDVAALLKTRGPILTWIAGVDSHGRVVACLAATADNGISPLSECR